MPLVHKSFKHFSSKLSLTSSFKILSSSSSSGGASWRKLFGKSSTSEASSSGKFSDSTGSSSVAPHIGTLNMTRASFSSTDRELPSANSHDEKGLPALPPHVLDGAAVSRKPVPHDLEERYLPEKVVDEEKAIPAATVASTSKSRIHASPAVRSWEPEECTSESRRNETKRAQYDLYPRT